MLFFPDAPLGLKAAIAYGLIFVRYLLFAGLGFWVFYIWGKQRWLHRRIVAVFPASAQYRREIAYSALSAGVFVLMGMAIAALRRAGYTQIYLDVSERGWAWFVASIPLMLLLHDTWFYWTHRLMHIPLLFRHIHKVHHLSHNPSPWAAFAFHPAEALIEAGILPLIAFAMPVHPLAFLLFFSLMMGYNVLGHLGVELFPPGFLRHPLGQWSNTSTHHHMHHRFTRCNYGLYFNLWDRLLGTNHPRYEAAFEEVASRKRKQVPPGSPAA